MNMTISIRLNSNESDLIRTYAEMNGMSVSELMRKSVMERIEDEYDLKAYEEAIADYKANPVTHDFMSVAKELDLL